MAFFNNPVEQRAKKTLSGFQAFILRGNVVDLAVGIMIGVAFSSVINGLVNYVITPLIPVTNTSLQKWTIGPVPWTKTPVQIGPFINTIITFLILAVIIYFFVVLPVNALVARYKPKENEAAPTTRDCPYCLSSINIMATRCAYCTSPLPPLQQAQPAPPPQQAQGAPPPQRS